MMSNQQKIHYFSTKRVILTTILLAGWLTACAAISSPQANNPQIPAEETPADTIPTLGSGESLAPNPQATSTPALIPLGTNTVSLEALPTAADQTEEAQPQVDFGIADLAIIRPGQLSRHTSPIRVIANFSTLQPFETEITLYGEDGRVLASKTLWSKPYNDPINGNLITDVEFSLPVSVETGRLELKAFDDSGRIWVLNSVYLILLSRGITDRNYAPENQDRILLQLPFPDQRVISSSPIFVSGLVRSNTEFPLTIWLIDEAGNILGEGQAPVVNTTGSSYAQFVGEIPFQVSETTRVLMTIGLQEGRIPGFTYIKTIEFTLQPANN